MIPALLLSFFVAVTPSEQSAVARFCQALTSSEIRTMLPMVNKPSALSTDSWSSVRDLFEHYDCISIPSYRVRSEGDWLVVEMDGSGITLNARHERKPIPAVWYLKPGANGIAEAKSEADHVADLLIAAKNDDARLAIIEQHAEILPAVARQVMVLARRTDRARVKAPALSLLEWSQRNDDFASEAYAFDALARLARYAQDVPNGSRYALAAESAAQRTNDCEVIAYAKAIAAYLVMPDELRGRIRDEVIPMTGELDDPYPALYALGSRMSEEHDGADFTSEYRDCRLLGGIAQRFGMREQEMFALQTEAAIREELADWNGTIEVALQVLAIARKQLNAEYEARACHIIGESYAERDNPDYPRAVEWLRKAVDTLPPTLMRGPLFKTNLGNALVQTGRVREAEQYLAVAFGGSPALTFSNRAYVFGEHLRHAQGRYTEAIKYARDGIATTGENDPYYTWELKADLGNMLIECGEAEGGIESLREAIDLIETRRILNTSDALARAQHFATRQWVYESLVDALASQKQFEEAFSIAERMKARELEDSLAGAKERLPLSAGEQAEQRALNQRIVELNRKLITTKGNAPRQELRQARLELETFNTGMAMRYATNIPDAAEVPLPSHGTIVEYAILPHSIVAFVIRDGRVTGTRLKTSRTKIERDAAQLTSSIRKRDLGYATKARTLYDALIKPVAAQLNGAITIVPDGFLWNVPFDALLTPSHTFLLEEHAIAYAPSVMMLNVAARHRRTAPAEHELLAVGDPSIATAALTRVTHYRDLSLTALPDAAREALAVASLYGPDSKALVHGYARESMVKKLAPDYRILHLATHGFVDDDSPLYSALVLASSPSDRDDGLLEMREVRDLDLHADLIVLSACDTARGTVFPGEGVVGLSWAFLTSGCPTTVVSQWNVESHSTSQLMIDFHKRLRAGETVESALRRAKLALMRDKRYAHPLYWAPFIVVGDGVARIR